MGGTSQTIQSRDQGHLPLEQVAPSPILNISRNAATEEQGGFIAVKPAAGDAVSHAMSWEGTAQETTLGSNSSEKHPAFRCLSSNK